MADTVYCNNDSFINNESTGTNYNGEDLEVYTGDDGGMLVSLLGFDLSAYSGMTINSATLYIYAVEIENADMSFGFKRITSSWAEASVTWATAPSAAATVYNTTTWSVDAGWKTVDLTSLVQAAADGSDFYGI
jgi:hypothetical protein